MEYIRTCYRVPAKRGAKVIFRGRLAEIVGSQGAYLLIRVEGRSGTMICHPTWDIEYLPKVAP